MLPPLPGAARLAGAAALLLLAGCAKETAAPGTSPTPSPATTANAAIANGVMMQGFYWDVPQTTSGQTW